MYFCHPFQSIKFVPIRREDFSLRDISLRQNYESLIGEINLRLGVSRMWTCQKKRVSSLPKFANFSKNLR